MYIDMMGGDGNVCQARCPCANWFVSKEADKGKGYNATDQDQEDDESPTGARRYRHAIRAAVGTDEAMVWLFSRSKTSGQK